MWVCALLDRTARRIVPQSVHYRGVEFVDEYVLGYGLHVLDSYRNLPYVVAADREVLVTNPDAYISALYRSENAPRGPVVG